MSTVLSHDWDDSGVTFNAADGVITFFARNVDAVRSDMSGFLLPPVDLERDYSFGNANSSNLFFCYVLTNQTFLILDAESGTRVDLPLSAHYING